MAVRVVAVARDAELWERRAGWPATVEVLARRRGHGYDPAVVDVAGRRRAGLAGRARRRSVRRGARRRAGTGGDDRPGRVSTTALARGGRLHRPQVAVVARSLARRGPSGGGGRGRGRAARRPTQSRSAGRRWCTTSGSVGVPNGIWDRPRSAQRRPVGTGPAAPLPERAGPAALRVCWPRSPTLAARHHERADGSGYHRGTSAATSSTGRAAPRRRRRLPRHDRGPPAPARADRRPTPPRSSAARSTPGASDGSRSTPCWPPPVSHALPRRGHEPGRAHRPRGRGAAPDRPRPRSTSRSPPTLGISAKTVGHHVEHIYAKAGVTTRAGATLFAMEHGLLLALSPSRAVMG